MLTLVTPNAERAQILTDLDDGDDGEDVVVLDVHLRHDLVLRRAVRLLVLGVHLVLEAEHDAPRVLLARIVLHLEDPVEDLLHPANTQSKRVLQVG